LTGLFQLKKKQMKPS